MKKTISWILCFAMLVSAFSFCMPIFAVELDAAESVVTMPVVEEVTETNEAELASTTNLWPNETFDTTDGLTVKAGSFNWQRQLIADPTDETNSVMSFVGDGPFIANAEALNVVNGTEYTLSFRAYGVDGSQDGNNGQAGLKAYLSAGTIGNSGWLDTSMFGTYEMLFEETITELETWATYEYTFTASDATKYLTFYSDDYTVYFDDVKITSNATSEEEPEEPAELNYWPNETLDTNNGLYFKTDSPQWFGQAGQTDPTDDTNKAAKFYGSQGPYITNATAFELVDGATYEVSFRMLPVTATATLKVRVSTNKPYSSWFGFDGATSDLAVITTEALTLNEWDTYSYEFTAGEATKYLSFYADDTAVDTTSLYVDDIKVTLKATVEEPGEEPETTNLWPDSGFDAVAVNGENQAQNTDSYRYFSQANWQSKVMTETNGNKYFRMTGTGGGNPYMSNTTAFEIDTTKPYLLTFKVSEMYDASATEAKVNILYSSTTYNDRASATFLDAVIPAQAATTDPSAAPAWEEASIEIPAGTDCKYIYFYVPTGYLGLDDISLVEQEAPETPEVVETNYWPNEKFNDTTGLYFKHGAPTWWNNVTSDPAGGTNMVMQFSSNGPFITNDVALDLVNGMNYVVSFRVYGTAETSAVKVRTSENKPYPTWFGFDGTTEDLGIVTTTTPNEWNTYEYTFTASDATKYLSFYVENFTIYLDDVKVTAKKETGVIPAAIGLAAPVANAAPAETLTTGFYNATVEWSPAVETGFAYATEYTATVTLALNENCELLEGENAYTVEGATSVTNEDGSNVITVVFPATAAAKPAHAVLNTNLLTNNTNPVTFEEEANVVTGNIGEWNVAVDSDPEDVTNKYLHLKGWAGTYTEDGAFALEPGRPADLTIVYYVNNKYSTDGLAIGLTYNHTNSAAADAHISTVNNAWASASYKVQLEDALTSIGIYACGGYNSEDTSFMDHTYIDSISLSPYDSVTFYSDAETPYTTEYFYAEEITFEDVPTPSKSGYTFAGWATSPDATEAITSLETTTDVEDFELYALWTEGDLFTMDTEYYGVRNDKYATGIRIKASFAAAQLENMTEIGFIVADDYFVDGDLTLGTDVAVSAVLYNGDDKNVIYSNDGTTAEVAVILDFTNVDVYSLDYDFIIRPYAKVNGVTLYGEALTTNLITYLEAIKATADYENFEYVKDYVDTMLDAYYA